MLFKGTTGRSSLDIVKFIEGLGGSFDAFTTKESLIIITKFLSEHLESVFGLIAEMLLQSKVDETDITKEKAVILEEIKSDVDDPSEYIFDLLFENLFPGHPMGLPIAGTQETVSGINVNKARRFYRELLTRKIVIAVSGMFDHDKLAALVRSRFTNQIGTQPQRIPPAGQPRRLAVQTKKEISQVHLAFALPSISYASPQRHAVLLLSTMFGGGMSSRLFQDLREKEGLVYDVHSFVDFYGDCGIFGYYLVCDKKNAAKASQRIRAIFKEIKQNGFTEEEIEIAKTYITGNLLLSLESSTNRMMRLGRELLQLGKITEIDDMVGKIKGVSREEIMALAQDYLQPDKYTAAAIGPVTEKEIRDIFGL